MQKRLLLLKELLFRPAYNIAYFIISWLGIFDTLVAHIPALKSYIDGLAMNNLAFETLAWVLVHWFGILVVVVLIAVFEGAYKTKIQYTWSEPKIKLIPNAEGEQMGWRVSKHAYLYVFNGEDLPITDCYATIESGKLFYEMRQVEFVEEDHLKWAEIYAVKGYKIEIPPKKQLRIDVADTLERGKLRFSRCNSTQSSPMGIYSQIRIRVDGNFNGKAMKPQIFEGYLYAEEKGSGWNEIETTTKVVDGKRIVDSIINIQLPYVDMVFEEGDWMKDRHIPKPKELGQKDEKKEVFTKKDFLKALDKVIGVVKKKPSGKGKKGTSG